jgi:hypothetical protein
MRQSHLVPPDKFGAIEAGVYRSAFPTPESFGHLKLLALRTVVNLSLCTFSDERRFFSYRRSCLKGEPDYGRGLSAIVLDG